MKVYVGADHNGFEFKEDIKRFLQNKGYEVVDVGNFILDSKDDYPIFAFGLGKGVVKDRARGILICGSAQGMCIAANKVKGVKAATVKDVKEARLVREQNDANVICISGWHQPSDVKNIVMTFLKTEFSHAVRHGRRVKRISDFESGK